MISNQHIPSRFFDEYKYGIDCINSQNRDNFHNQLYFSNVISLMEKYLYDLFLYEITNDRIALVKLGSQNKFKSESLKIPYLLHNCVEDFIINSMKNLVWHRLNDVDVFYKNVLNISININSNLLGKLKIRHDIVHRNGCDINDNKVKISDHGLDDCISTIDIFIKDIDKKYQSKKNQ